MVDVFNSYGPFSDFSLAVHERHFLQGQGEEEGKADTWISKPESLSGGATPPLHGKQMIKVAFTWSVSSSLFEVSQNASLSLVLS